MPNVSSISAAIALLPAHRPVDTSHKLYVTDSEIHSDRGLSSKNKPPKVCASGRDLLNGSINRIHAHGRRPQHTGHVALNRSPASVSMAISLESRPQTYRY